MLNKIIHSEVKKIAKGGLGFLFLITFTLACESILLAQTPPEKILSEQERARQLQETEKALREKIEKEKKEPSIKEEVPAVQPAAEAAQKVFIQNISVTEATLISGRDIQEIISPFQNQELSIKDMQKVADLITDAYRQKGYITSRAYLPAQKIEKGVLEIKVVEGRMGNVEVKGNRYFKTKFILSKLTLEKGNIFNYNTLRKDLIKINRNPDRFARAVLIPGKEPGETDIILEVKDRLAFHIGIDWDTFGSRYIDKHRYSVRFIDNNFLGLDDNLAFQYQLAQSGRYFLKNARYLLPLENGWQIGAFTSHSRVKLGEEFQDSDVRGKAHVYGLFVSKSVIDADNLDVTLNLGFDYKDVTNFQFQRASSEDRLRVSKIGFDLDLTDSFGRTILAQEFDYGIPDIMGGLKKRSPSATRSGAGGEFTKNTINLLRLQKMPFSSTLLLKNQIQTTPYTLTSTEQFQIGGIANVRGYPPAEVVGDNGYSSTFEWSFPAYFVPKNISVPFSKAKVYDSFRFAMFYDWANTHLRRPLLNEEKNKTLRGVGWGIRFNLPEDFSARVDFGWPLDNTPSDGRHLHTWAQVSKSF